MYGLFEAFLNFTFAIIAIGCTVFAYRKFEPRRYRVIVGILVAAAFVLLPAISMWKEHQRENYFEDACRTDAGEIIYKTVKNVEGIYEMKSDFPNYRAERYLFVQPPKGRYKFREVDSGVVGNAYIRYYRFENGFEVDGKKKMYRYSVSSPEGIYYSKYTADIVAEENANVLKSRYGFFWKRMTTEKDSKLGIERTDLVLKILDSNETLARKRFITLLPAKGTIERPWHYDSTCSGLRKDSDEAFVYKVMIPTE